MFTSNSPTPISKPTLLRCLLENTSGISRQVAEEPRTTLQKYLAPNCSHSREPLQG
jgi:hypothetical protein